MKNCLKCQKELSGRRTHFCSKKCKSHFYVNTQKIYQNAKKRALNAKKHLIKLHGGKCAQCNYKENYAALSFHHIDPSQKSFELSVNNGRKKSLEQMIQESYKCILLCVNCHNALHHPEMSIEILKNQYQEIFNGKTEKLIEIQKSKS